MKISSLLAVLSNFEAAVAAAAGTGTPSGFKELRQLFLGHDEGNVAPLVKTLLKQRDIHGSRTNSPPIAHLREALTKLETCLRSAGGKMAADDVAKLAELLEGCGQVSVSELVSEAREWLAEASQPKARLEVKAKPATPAREKNAAPPVETMPPTAYAALLKQTLASPIVSSLQDKHFTCLNHGLMQQLGTIGQAIYMRTFFHFANHYTGIDRNRLSFQKRYDDMCAEWLGGLTVLAYKADIIRDQLGPHLNQLIATGFLSSYGHGQGEGPAVPHRGAE